MLGIREFFAKKNLFVTGATGFLGKVLIEKLLRSCPDIGNIYVLIRTKRNKLIGERVQAMFENPLFDTLKEKYPEQIKKVQPISGDITEVNLGISEEDQKMLIENVHLVYNVAASIRFDDELKTAIISNVRSTKFLIELSLKIENLILFVHISTAFCNVDKTVVEEMLYPAHGNWREAIEIAEHGDNQLLEHMRLKYIDPLPNTYVYTKSLAEHVVADLCGGKIPAIIIRPSIVTNTFDDPISGWTDNFYGIVGLAISVIKGASRIILCNAHATLDMVPVDFIIKYIIQASYKHGFLDIRKGDVEIYNASKGITRTTVQLCQHGLEDAVKFPCENMLWYPNTSLTNCRYWYFVAALLYQILPALFLDMLLFLSGKKPMVFKLQKKIYLSNYILFYFGQKAWVFNNSKMRQLDSYVPQSEREIFCLPSEYMKQDNEDAIITWQTNSTKGVSKYLFKEGKGVEYLPKLRRMWVMDKILKIILAFVLYRLFLVKWNLFAMLLPL